MQRFVFGVLLTLLVAACSNSQPRTAVVVTASADAEVIERATHIQVVVRGGTGSRDDWDETHNETLQDPEWPVTMALVPLGGDASRQYEVTITAHDAGGEFSRVRAISSFIPKTIVTLPLLLESKCIDVSVACTGAQTCEVVEGAASCVSARTDASDLEVVDPGNDGGDSDAAPQDAGVDDARGDADANTDASADADMPAADAADADTDADAAPEPPPSSCSLFRDTFERPDGSALGAAELPAGANWRSVDVDAEPYRLEAGSLTWDESSFSIGGTVSGFVAADIGDPITGTGFRLRYKVRFDEANTWVSIGFGYSGEGATTGLGAPDALEDGLRVSLSLLSDAVVLRDGDDADFIDWLSPELGTDYYVECVVAGAQMEVTVSTTDYALDGGSTVFSGSRALLQPLTLGGSHIAIAINDGSDDAPNVQEVSLERYPCP